MTRLRSDDPVSRAVASSFLAFLQNSIELTNDADAEALEVAVECLSSVFNLEQTQFSSFGHPDLLPQIFRLLLNQGLGQSTISGQNVISGPRVSGGFGQNPADEQQGFGHNVDSEQQGSGRQNTEQQFGAPLIASPTNIDSTAIPGSMKASGNQSLQRECAPSAPLQSVPAAEPHSHVEANAVPPAGNNGGGPSTPQRKEGGGNQVPEGMGSLGVSQERENAWGSGTDIAMKDVEEPEDRRRRERGKDKEDTQPSRTSRSGGSDSSQDKLRKEADDFKKQGNDAMSAGRYYEALELYTQAISLVDDVAIYFSNRAAAHHQLGQYDLAIKDCEQSIRLDPRYVRAFSRLGLAYFEKGDCQTAINRGFLKALELDPDNTVVKQNLKAAQEKLARQARRQQTPAQQPEALQAPPQQGPHPSGGAQTFPQAPQNVQGLVNMAANLFTPLASMATGGGGFRNAAPGGQVPANQGAAFQGGQGPIYTAGGFQGFNAQAPPGGHVPFHQQPGTTFPNVFGQNQGTGGVSFNFPRGNGARQMQGQQVQDLLAQMFQAFGAASQQSGSQGEPQGPQRSPS